MPLVCTDGTLSCSLCAIITSNDVEENPGPRTINDIVDPTYTVHVDFNQGSELMFGMNAGKQCVSLYAIVYKEIKPVNI